MVFRSKIDNYFVIILLIALTITFSFFLVPSLLNDQTSTKELFVLSFLVILITGFVLWTILSIRYVFYNDHLYVKAGFFRSRIRYTEITRLTPTKEILSGYRLLSSKDALEIYYESGVLGSIKVSPRDTDLFIAEIKKRCPYITLHL